MKKIILILAGLVLLYDAGAQQRIAGKDVFGLWSNETTKVTRREPENGRWEKYRRWEYNNLRIDAIDFGGRPQYVLSRYYTQKARHLEVETDIMPIFSIHLHWWYSGCVLNPEDFEILRDIAPGERIKVEQKQTLMEFEAHEYDDFFRAVVGLRPSLAPKFFLWIELDKKGKTIRIIDTDDPDGYEKGYWELPYKRYRALFESPR